jgi:hypothetical protein
MAAVATPQEKVLLASPGWTDEQARRALFAATHDPAPDGRIVDRWGDLSALGPALSHDSMDLLDAEERAAGIARWKVEDLS